MKSTCGHLYPNDSVVRRRHIKDSIQLYSAIRKFISRKQKDLVKLVVKVAILTADRLTIMIPSYILF